MNARKFTWIIAGVLVVLAALATASGYVALRVARLKHPESQLQDQRVQRIWLQVMGVGASLAVLGGITLFDMQRRSPRAAAEYGSHGTARWARPEELRNRLGADGPGLIVGQVRGPERKASPRYLIQAPAARGLNQFCLVFGGAGSYKTSAYVLPNLLHEEETSVVVSDPKGECYRTTAHVKKKQDYRVFLMDLIHQERSLRWNPLDYVNTPQDALRLASTIIANTDNPEKSTSGDPFWPMAEQAFITSMVLFVKLHLDKKAHHLGNVVTLGTELKQEQLNQIFDELPQTDPSRRYYRTFRQADDKVRSGIVIGFATRLQLWNDDAIIALTSASDFELKSLGTTKTILYVVIPAGERTYGPLLALFWNQMTQELVRLADESKGQLPVPVRMRMEEAANIGTVPDLEQRVSTTRGIGIWWEFIFQTLGQFQARYPRVWSEIAGNCDTWLYLGGNDLETQQYMSSRLGTTTIQVQATSSNRTSRNESVGESAQYTARALQMADELGRLPEDKQLLLQRGQAPALVDKPFYREHPAYEPTEGKQPHPVAAAERGKIVHVDVKSLLPNKPTKGTAKAKQEEDD